MKILLADDHTLVRENLCEFLYKLGPDVEVFEAGDFPESLEIARREPVLNLALLDLVMPGMNGLEGLQTLRKELPDVPIVIMSGVASRIQAMQVLDKGAAGFIPKTIGGEALLRALRLVLAGDKYVPEMILGPSSGDLAESDRNGAGPSPIDRLTDREREALILVAEGHSNKAIARLLEIREVTVKVHLQSVFRKLGVANRTQAATVAMQEGLVSTGPGSNFNT